MMRTWSTCGYLSAGAVNVPFTDLLEGSSPAGRFQSPDELRKVLENAGVDLAKPIICSCGSGATAAILAHALVQVGTDLVCIPRTDSCS